MGRSEHAPVITARQAGLVGCRRCARAWPMGTQTCGACGSHLKSRDDASLQRVWAWWIAGLMAYIPANLYPMLETRTLFISQSNTIVGGAIDLASHGSYGVATIILVASVLIPIGKFLAIAYLAISVHRSDQSPGHPRQTLFEVVEYIGRWSMIDVFVVAILASLVHLGSVASISPGPASLTFSLSVICTMLSAQSFDSRLIWDQLDPQEDTTT